MPASADAAAAQRVEFKLFRNLGFPGRMAIIAAALVAGLLCQVFIGWLAGIPFVLFGVLMGLCNDVTNKPKSRGRSRWENVTAEELRKADELCRKSQEWARDPFSLSGINIGIAVFLLMGAVVAAVVFYFHTRGEINLRNAVVADGGIMLVLLFATGRRRAWQPEGIGVKLLPLLNVCTYLESYPDPAIQVRPILEIRGTGEKAIPYDCRLMLKLKGAPKDFYGIQVQTSLNEVQGTPFPYMYCVLLAKRGSGLVSKVTPLLRAATERVGFFSKSSDKKNPDLRKKRYLGEVAEPEVQPEVELVVVRQVTLGRGYHTTPDDQLRVLSRAIDLAKRVWGV